MRRKKLDVVFDETVNLCAERITKKIMDSVDDGKCSVNKSEVLRCAMELGLAQLDIDVDKNIEKGTSAVSFVKIKNIKSIFRK